MMNMTLTEKQLKTLPKLKTELAYSKVEHLLSVYYENQLKKEVSQIFRETRYEVIRNLTEYYDSDMMFQAHMDLILAPIHEYHKKYYETLLKYKIREFDKSRDAGKRIVERTINFRRKGNVINKQFTVLKADINDMVSSTISKDKLFGTSEIAHNNLASRTYILSEKTLSRVDTNINDIITKGYDEGWGVNKVAHEVNTRFNQLETWESSRIARTEIHNSHSLGLIQGYDDMGVEYIQWSAANDNRTRDTHINLDGEIIPLGGVFSNGLMYPGDMLGSAEEVINCRCQALPYIIPYGYIAPPDMAQFREEDLIATLDYFNKDELIAQAMAETEVPMLSDTEIIQRLNELPQRDKFRELYKILSKYEQQEYQQLYQNLKRLDINSSEYAEIRHKMLKYEKLIFKPEPVLEVPNVDYSKFLLDNQEVGGAPTIEETILEKKQIELQQKISLVKEDIYAGDYYFQSGHKNINGFINNDKEWQNMYPSVKKEIEKYVRGMNIPYLDRTIKRVPGLAQDTTLYRACDVFDGSLKPGQKGKFKQYISTTFQKKSADAFSASDRYDLTILAPKGQKGVVANDGRFDVWIREHEWLLPRNQEYIVLETTPPKGSVPGKATILLIR